MEQLVFTKLDIVKELKTLTDASCESIHHDMENDKNITEVEYTSMKSGIDLTLFLLKTILETVKETDNSNLKTNYVVFDSDCNIKDCTYDELYDEVVEKNENLTDIDYGGNTPTVIPIPYEEYEELLAYRNIINEQLQNGNMYHTFESYIGLCVELSIMDEDGMVSKQDGKVQKCDEHNIVLVKQGQDNVEQLLVYNLDNIISIERI